MSIPEFINNPTGLYGLSYNPGDVVDFDEAFAMELIESGYAVQAKDEIEDAEQDQTGKETSDIKRKRR